PNFDVAKAAYDNYMMNGLMTQLTRLKRGDKVEEAHMREARHPNGDPRQPLYWLVEFLRARGIGLRRGQSIITGSLAGVVSLPAQRHARLRFGDLGSMTWPARLELKQQAHPASRPTARRSVS
ncbi:MAG: hypothetical protein ABIW85_10645, partial [Variovorax sp.]